MGSDLRGYVCQDGCDLNGGATIAVLARSQGRLSRVKACTPTIAGLAVVGLVLADLLLRTSYRLKDTMQLAVLCTLFVWLWGALVVATLTVAAGTLLQRVTCSLSLRTFGKYSFALYLFHGHANRLFAKIGFNPDHGIVIGPTVLPWQTTPAFPAAALLKPGDINSNPVRNVTSANEKQG